MGFDLGLIFAHRITFLKIQNSLDKINEFIEYHAETFIDKRHYFLLKYFCFLCLICTSNNNIKELFSYLIRNEIDIAS
jgi:hypothetical protein